ncbi:MAG: hypothetical protein H7070_10965 [Saprospiraceae bacterium]|nr:hypothetical protein [Pyrinomonadaceae bacterium]
MKLQQHLKVTWFAALILLVFGFTAFAQEEHKREFIQATAQGTSTQLGRMISIDLTINEHSTADDQKALIEAFEQKGSEGVANALHKMHSKGRIAITGTLGYDVAYIREFKMPDGSRKIRVITDRPITFGEAWSASRSQDYNLSALEIIISEEKGKSHGTLLPACQFKIDKEKALQIETFQNPWKLMNVQVRK